MPNFVHTKVDPDRLKMTADNINQNITSINRAFDVIDKAIEALGLFWKGTASQQYLNQYKLDESFFKSHMEVLEQFNYQLREAAGIFDSADEKAREQVDLLKIG